MTGFSPAPVFPALLLLALAPLAGLALAHMLPRWLGRDPLWRARARFCPYRRSLPLACLGVTAGLMLADPSPFPAPFIVPFVTTALTAVWLWLLLALIFTDLIAYRLPDAATASLLAVALAKALTLALLAAMDPLRPLAGALFGSGSFLLIRWAYQALQGREGLGLGDVKLMAGIGAGIGPLWLPHLVLLAAGLCLLWALGQTLRRRPPAADQPLPFGAALCLAAIVLTLGQALGQALRQGGGPF